MAKHDNYTVKLDSKAAKNMRTVLTLLLVVSILAFLFNVYGAYSADQDRANARAAKRAAKQIELVVTNKANGREGYSSVTFEFSMDITNNFSEPINYIEGVFTIMEKDGNVLSYGNANFGTDYTTTTDRAFKFPSKSTQKYTLSWDSDITDNSIKIWNSDFSDLRFSFEVTRVRVKNGKVADVA